MAIVKSSRNDSSNSKRLASDRTALDIDVILAAQALSFGPSPADVIIATSNAKHLAQFIPAQDWSEIVP